MQPHVLSSQLRLHVPDIKLVESAVMRYRNRRCNASTLPRDRTAHHVTRSGVAYPVATGDSPCANKIFHALGQQRAVGDLKVSPCGGQNQDAVAIDKFREYTDAVFKPTLIANVLFGHVVSRINFAGVAYPQGHPEITEFGALTAGGITFQCLDRHHGLLASLDLAAGQIVGVRAVVTQ